MIINSTIIGGGDNYVMWEFTTTEDQTGTITLLSDKPEFSHYADTNATAILIPQFQTTGNNVLGAFLTSNFSFSTDKSTLGCVTTSSGITGSTINSGKLTDTQSTASGIQLLMTATTVSILGSTRNLLAGTYRLIFIW